MAFLQSVLLKLRGPAVGRNPPNGAVFQEMMPFLSYPFILLAVCAIFYYRAGEFEGSSGLAWAALSVLVSVGILHWLHGGFLAILLGQVGLFGAITLYRSRKKA